MSSSSSDRRHVRNSVFRFRVSYGEWGVQRIRADPNNDRVQAAGILSADVSFKTIIRHLHGNGKICSVCPRAISLKSIGSRKKEMESMYIIRKGEISACFQTNKNAKPKGKTRKTSNNPYAV
ncbi:MAG: hypothetical protein IK099_05395 [Clostridia bacterium]|nr:hypothetical protein [Clostridia bacterium]